MSLFRSLAYLSPLAIGFGIATALALTSERPPKRRATAAGGVLGGVPALLLFASFADAPRQWFPLALLLISFGLLVAGIFLVCESAKAPRELSQIVAGLAVCFLMSTLFWMGPIIRSSADAGASGEAIFGRITLAMSVNPFFTMAYSIFNDDLLHLPFFYRTDLAGFQYKEPRWPATSAGYAVTGLLLGAVAVTLRRARKPA
jgi:uncharacterized membrane protein